MPLPQISSVTSKIQSLLPQQKSAQPAVYVLVDVGSSEVRAAVARMEQGEVRLLGIGRAKQADEAMIGGVIGQLDLVLEKMDEAITQAADTAGVTSDQLILSLSGAVVGGITTMVHLNRPQPKDKISDKEFQLMLERMSQTALADAEDQVSQEMGLPKEDLRLINSAITSINLDGYALPSPIGFAGKEVEFCLFNAFIASSSLVALQKILTDLNMDLSALSSGPYALAQLPVLLAPKSQQAHALVVDVGAGSTSVTLVEHGAVSGSGTFPLGGRAITARIAQTLDVPLAEAEQIKLSYAANKADDAQQHAIRPVVMHEVSMWLHALVLSLSQIHPDKSLPDHIYIAGGGAQLPDLGRALEKHDWFNQAGFAKAPKIELLKAKPLPGMVDDSSTLGDHETSLAALAQFLRHRDQEDAQVTAAFQKTLQALGGT